VEGRLQSDPRPPGRAALRLRIAGGAAAAGVIVLFGGLVASAVLGGVEVFPHVDDAIAHGSSLTGSQRRHAAGDRLHLDPVPFDAFLAQLRPRERYAVDVPPGAKGPFITRGAVVRAYSAFYFLPAIQVGRAPLLFRYRFR
jgi:hypothetical protein